MLLVKILFAVCTKLIGRGVEGTHGGGNARLPSSPRVRPPTINEALLAVALPEVVPAPGPNYYLANGALEC